MSIPAVETIELLCEVVELQSEIIRKQSIIIAQAEISFDDSSIESLKDEANEKLEQAL